MRNAEPLPPLRCLLPRGSNPIWTASECAPNAHHQRGKAASLARRACASCRPYGLLQAEPQSDDSIVYK